MAATIDPELRDRYEIIRARAETVDPTKWAEFVSRPACQRLLDDLAAAYADETPTDGR